MRFPRLQSSRRAAVAAGCRRAAAAFAAVAIGRSGSHINDMLKPSHGRRRLPNAVATLAVCAAALAGGHALAASKQVPYFDVDPSCRAAASRTGLGGHDATCRREEREAREQLERQWPQFEAADRARCVQRTRLGGQPTYTELLTCLELAREVRALRGRAEPVAAGGEGKLQAR
jgi:hypothetical protein